MNVITLALKIPLGQPCGAGDVCQDAQGECRGGACRCRQGYFETNDVCGKVQVKITLHYPISMPVQVRA